MKSIATPFIRWSAMLLALVCLSAGSSRASNFTVSGVDTIRAYVGDSTYNTMMVHNTSGHSLRVYIFGGGYGMGALSYTALIPTDSTAYVTIMFKPTSAGTHAVTFRVTDSVEDGYHTIVGVATTSPFNPHHVFVSNSSFESAVGGSHCENLFIMNDSGHGAITLTGITMYGSHSNMLADSGASLPLTLAENSGMYRRVCFTPTTAFSEADTIVVSWTDTSGAHYISDAGMYLYAYQPVVNYCPRVHGDSIFGPIDADSWVERQYTLVNNAYHTVRIDSVGTSTVDSVHWAIDGLHVNDSIAQRDTLHFSVKFYSGNDNTVTRFYSSLIVGIHDDSLNAQCWVRAPLYGMASYDGSSVDTSYTPIFADTTQTITLSMDRPGEEFQIVYLANNSGSALKIDTVYFLHGDHFRARVLLPDSVMPVQLVNSQSLMIRITLLDTTSGTYDDTLMVVTESGIQAVAIHIVGTRGVADVKETPHPAQMPAELSLVPNPAHGPVTISILNSNGGVISIFDMLGREMQTQDLRPNGALRLGGSLPAGSYIARYTGFDRTNHPIVISRRFVIEN